MNSKLNNEKKAEEIKTTSIARNGFNGNVTMKSTTQTPSFSGLIRQLRDIELEYNPSYPLHKINMSDPFSSALEALLEHEIIHKEDGKGRGCPQNEQLDIELILTPISRVLKRKNLPNVPFGSQGHTLYSYFANLYEDLIDNTIVSDNVGSQGVFLLYDDQAQHSGKFPELFEAFVKLQAMVFPDKTGISLLPKHFKQSEKARKAVRNFLERTKLLEIPREQRADYLSNSKVWLPTAEIFTEELSELVELQNIPSSFFPLFGNDFSRLNDEEVQMGLAYKAYREGQGAFEPPPFIENNSALLSVYRRLAKNIDIKANAHSVETERIISRVARRKFDFEKDSLERMEFGYNERGSLEAQTGKLPLRVKSRYQIAVGNIPEVRVGLVDCSDSTRANLKEGGKVMNPWAPEDRQWTDTSIYHQELLCVFGLYELFRRQGTLKHSNVKGGVFDSTTRMGNNLSESERIALQPTFRGTQFDDASLDNLFKRNGSLVYTISDGEVANWRDVKDRFIQGAKRHNYFHLQIGRKTEMYNDLKKAGLNPVLDDGQNSAKILIDLTQRNIYGAS